MKLSIITINFNNSLGLQKTIGSVIGQTFKDFEYIIIDGGSTDGSVGIIKQNAASLIYWISEPDKGIYNAMNKGIKIATGEYLLFLNSGDFLVDNYILEKISPLLKETDIIYGNGLRETDTGKYLKVEIPEKLKLEYFSGNSLFHPSSFIRKQLFNTYGLYNESNKIVSDWEFFIKTIMVNNVNAKKIQFEIAVAEEGGISRNSESRTILKEEIESVLNAYFPKSVRTLIDDYKRMSSQPAYPKKNIFEKFILKIKTSLKK